MKKRSIFFVLFLSIITLGIYNLYWLYATRKEMVAKGQSVPRLWPVFFPPVILALAVIINAVPVSSIRSNTSSISELLIGILLISVVVSIILGIRYLISYCHATETITNGELTAGFNITMAVLLTLFGVGFIWTVIVQYHFNRLGDNHGSPPQYAPRQMNENPIAPQPPMQQPPAQQPPTPIVPSSS